MDNLPANVEVTEGFESEQQVEGFRSMVTAIGYSVIIVYLIMALTFRSFVHPFTILFSLPFALVGAALALYLTNSVLGISAMIGLMMLVGIVVTNGIVLMELVQQLRKKGENAYNALVRSGPYPAASHLDDSADGHFGPDSAGGQPGSGGHHRLGAGAGGHGRPAGQHTADANRGAGGVQPAG